MPLDATLASLSVKAARQMRGARRFSGELLDVRGAAEFLGASERTIRARVARRLLPFRKFAGRVVFRRNELEQFIHDLPGVSVEEAQRNIALRSGEAVLR